MSRRDRSGGARPRSVGYSSGYNPYSPASYSSYSPYWSGSGSGVYGGTASGYGGVFIGSQKLKNLDKRIVASQKNLASEARRQGVIKPRSRSLTQLLPAPASPSRTLSQLSLGSSVEDGYCSGSERTSDVCESKDAVLESTGSAGGGGEKECERETDYRALWKASQQEVARLRELLSASERQARDSRATIARLTQVNQNSLTELEKREKRAMERKLSEMEEELKQLQKLKAENERLRAENRALTRVVSKLTNSAASNSK